MGIFNSIKKIFSNQSVDKNTQLSINNPSREEHEYKFVSKSNNYFHPIKSYHYKIINDTVLATEYIPTWNSFFSASKTNPKLIGFEQRSRKKFKHLYHNSSLLVAEAAHTIEVVTKEEVKQIFLKDTPFEKMSHATTNHKASIVQNNGKVGLIDYQLNHAILFEFDWQPFRFSMGDDFWLVGTRETYDGPGELYCFDYNGQLKWGLAFNEIISSMFGEISFMPYILDVSSDSTDIFVASMDRLYRLDSNGQLKARIAISELKESELKRKHEELQLSLSKPPKTEEEAISMFAKQLAAEFSLGFERMTFNSPFRGFAHDPQTDMVFVLEDKGRVSAWSDKGELVWINIFKNEGRYISWIDNKLVISFNSGETFWMNRDGKVIYGAKLPKQASSIGLIPNQEKYLVVCEDNRLYELHKTSGELIKGSEGYVGMELFTLSGRTVFFDGEGYFWLAPENHEWKHYEAKTIVNSDSTDTKEKEVAPEIAPIKDFNKQWAIKSKDGWYGNRLIDFQHQRIYVVERNERTPIEKRIELSESERKKEFRSHNLVCLDFKANTIWKKQLYSSMLSLSISPDGEYLFTSIPQKDEITYLPGHLLVLSKDADEVGKIKVPAQSFDLEFLSDNMANISLASENRGESITGLLYRNSTGKWIIEAKDISDSTQNEFGAGLHNIELPHYTLTRTDKKKYALGTEDNHVELKLTAAIYEAYETNENKLVVRIGTRVVSFYTLTLEKSLEVKETENITSVVLGSNSFVVVTKKEVKGYDYTGEVLWKYSPIPKSYESIVYWVTSQNLYLWVVSNNLQIVVATISEDGTVEHSQAFSKDIYHRDAIVSIENECFVVQSNDTIESYTIF